MNPRHGQHRLAVDLAKSVLASTIAIRVNVNLLQCRLALLVNEILRNGNGNTIVDALKTDAPRDYLMSYRMKVTSAHGTTACPTEWVFSSAPRTRRTVYRMEARMSSDGPAARSAESEHMYI